MSISQTVGALAQVVRQGFTLLQTGQIGQAAALCYRDEGGKRRFLLISGRRSRKLGLPKGNIDPGETSQIAAAREAFEEAGVQGVAIARILTSYTYAKADRQLRRHVVVHPLEVTAMSEQFPEQGARVLKWLSASEAARLAGEPAVKALFQSIADGELPDLSAKPAHQARTEV